MPRNHRLYLEDILESAGNILDYVGTRSLDELITDRMRVDAVVRNFEIIGEAAAKVPEDIRKTCPAVEWRKISDFRNVLAHEYFKVDFEIMWDIIKNKLPELISNIKELLDSPDEYSSYEALSKTEIENKDYDIKCEIRRSKFAIMAPHGGGIEPGTSEITEAIAGNDYTYYCFNGIKRAGNKKLHIASEMFDEPKGIAAARSANIVISVHGCNKGNDKIFVGGLNEDIKEKIVSALVNVNFKASKEMPRSFEGKHPSNICNKGTEGKGIQLEISESLRRKMFDGLDRKGRKEKKEVFNIFIQAIRTAIEQ